MGNIVIVFSLSFLTTLSGAMQPGPLLSYAIVQTLKDPKTGFLMGPRIILGHALLEMCIIAALLFGISFILRSTIVVRFMGVFGGLFLFSLGVLTLRDVFVKKVDLPGRGEKGASKVNNPSIKNPVLGGVLISMSNPFWWVWWATILYNPDPH